MITFFTNCYEADWQELMLNGGIDKKINSCQCEFLFTILIINNVNNKEIVRQAANDLVENNVITNYYFAEEFSDLVLMYFDIKIDSFEGGYWYSIAPLVAIYVCSTKYMVYLTGDVICEKSNYDWIGKGIEMLLTYNNVKVINPIWNNKHDEALKEQDFYTNRYNLSNNFFDWHFGCSFSDQCFLIKTNDFIGKIYNEEDILSDAWYPKYAGNSFEKRISSYLKNKQYLRVTSKHSSYKHPII